MFKRTLIILTALLVVGGAAFAQTTIEGLTPKDARSMGMGGAFRAFSTGYSTFYGNPAGLASKNGSLTIVDAAVWAYVKPTTANIEAVQNVMSGGGGSQVAGLVEDLIVDNGLGAGAAIGIGWAGRGFGLGLTMVTDQLLAGSTLLGANMTSETELNGLVGLAFPLRLGPVTFKVGADARVFYRVQAAGTGWSARDIIVPILSDPNADFVDVLGGMPIVAGYGIAGDVGGILEFGPLMAGVAYRNLGMGFKMANATMGDVLEGDLPMNGTVSYSLTPELTAGLGFKLDGWFLAPAIYAEVSDPIEVISDTNKLWANLHAGAELKLLSFITARAGLNQGYLSFGAGLDLLILEIDAAIFTEEVGMSPGDYGRTGVSVQAAFRF